LAYSFTFGLRVADNETFGRQARETVFERRTDRRIPSKVVSAGVISYCPLARITFSTGITCHVLEPDLVVLNFDMSDVQDHMAYSRDAVPASPDGVPLFVTEPSLRNQRPARCAKLLLFEWPPGGAVQGLRGRSRVDAARGFRYVRRYGPLPV
jgi:hypothetical protein